MKEMALNFKRAMYMLGGERCKSQYNNSDIQMLCSIITIMASAHKGKTFL